MKQKIRNTVLLIAFVTLSGYFLLNNGNQVLWEQAEKACYPAINYIIDGEKERNSSDVFLRILSPLYSYVNDNAQTVAEVEDDLTYEMIMAQQANDEYTMSEDLEIVA